MLVVLTGENRRTWRKTPRSKVRANSKIGPHMKSGWNRTQATLVGGERSHHSVRHSWPCAKVIHASRWGRVTEMPLRRPCQEFVSFLQVRQNLGPSIPYSYFEMQMLIVQNHLISHLLILRNQISFESLYICVQGRGKKFRLGCCDTTKQNSTFNL